MQRRIDEWESVVERLPPLDRAYQIDFRLLSDRLAEIPDDVNGILRLFDGRRTLAQVLEEADQGGLAAAKALARLWSEEIIRPAAPGNATRATPQPPRDMDEESETQGVTIQPEAAEWFSGPAEAERAPAPPSEDVSDAIGTEPGRVADDVPRIVRFPAKRKEARTSSSDMEAISMRSAGLVATAEVKRRVSPRRRSTRHAAHAEGRRRRSVAAALLLAGSVLAGVVIWRLVASRSDASGDAGPSPTSSSSSSTAPAEPSLSRDSALGRGKRDQGSPAEPSLSRDRSSAAPAEPSQPRAPAPSRAETRPGVHRGKRDQGSPAEPSLSRDRSSTAPAEPSRSRAPPLDRAETRPGVHRGERGQGSVSGKSE